MPGRDVREHWSRVVALGCMVTGAPASLHHVHGRSVGARLASLGLSSTKGFGQRGYGDYLVIPLAPELHYLDTGAAIDGSLGSTRWEELYGSQADLVDQVGDRLGYSLWELHAKHSNLKSRRLILTG